MSTKKNYRQKSEKKYVRPRHKITKETLIIYIIAARDQYSSKYYRQ